MEKSLQAISAANRDVADTQPCAQQDCREHVHIALFFDGTGNNRFADAEKQCWSNVARLFLTAREAAQQGLHRIYLSGVGTRFSGRTNWAEHMDVWIQDNVLGATFGAGGERRLYSGDEQMSGALEQALLQNAREQGGQVQRIAERMNGEGFEKMLEAIAEHRLIKSISFSIFGFSRGAALARAFSNRLADELQPTGDGKKYTYRGIVARIAFLGVFDTVASFGPPTRNWSIWQSKELSISRKIEQCYHFTAAHELRFSFPLDLIREGTSYHSNMVERVYPGAHSDVGGGYEPKKQGRKDTLARVPLQDMLTAAIAYGVRLHSLEYLQRTDTVTANMIVADNAFKHSYTRYLQACIAKGTVEQQVQAHVAQYYSYRGTMHRRKVGTGSTNDARLTQLRQRLKETNEKESSAESKKWHEFFVGTVPSWQEAKSVESALESKIDSIKAELAAAEKDAQRLAASDSAIAIQAYALRRALETGNDLTLKDGQLIWVLEKHPWMLEAWQSEANNDVIHFFENYVHDSRTDFIGGKEPFVYFRTRGMYAQNQSA